MATLDELGSFVATACSLTVGEDLFKGQMPPQPDESGCLYEYGGLPPDHVFSVSSISVEHPRIQVVFRGEPDDYAAPRALAETAYRAMAAASAQTISSTRYLAMEPIQSPFLMGKDANGRILVGFNVQIHKALSA